MQNKRLFLAINFDNSVKNEFQSIIEQYKKTFFRLPITWAKTDNIHLTLKFIGDYPTNKIESLNIDISKITGKTKFLNLDFSRSGAFPSVDNPRILWLGIEKNNSLNTFVNEINEINYKFGIKRDKNKFFPHLTLGRIKSNLNPTQLQLLKDQFFKTKKINIPQQNVKSISLYESTLKPNGPVYNELSKFKLNS